MEFIYFKKYKSSLAFQIIENDYYKYSKFQYIEYDESHESTGRIREIDLTYRFRHAVLVGSCNGLLCFSRESYGSLLICNPITREYVLLPRIRMYSDLCLHCGRTIGFGYVSSTNEYKVVGLYALRHKCVEVYVYTLGIGVGWRNLGRFNYEFYPYKLAQVFFANGTLYWMNIHTKMIYAFDLAEEKFREDVSLPPLPPDADGIWRKHRMGVLSGFLFLAVSLNAERAKCYEIWLLRKKNGDLAMKKQEEHQSLVWNKEFRISERNLLAITKNGVLTYIGKYQNGSKNSLSMYDTTASTSERLVTFKEPFRKVFPHMNTLVSLKELGEECTKTMNSAEGD